MRRWAGSKHTNRVCFHARNSLPVQRLWESYRSEWSAVIAESGICFIDQVFCSWCSENWRAQVEELSTMSQENAFPFHGQFDKMRTMESRGTEELEDRVPGKCMATP